MKHVMLFDACTSHLLHFCTNGTHMSNLISSFVSFTLTYTLGFNIFPQFYKCSIQNRKCHSTQKLHRPQPQSFPEGGAVCAWHHRGQTTCPPGHLQHPMSQEDQKDQGQQPPESLPVHRASIQKARSIQVHQSWDREIEKQHLSQGHQTVKQPLLAQRGGCLQTAYHWPL